MANHSKLDWADQRRGGRLREAMLDNGYAKQHAFAVALEVSESTVTRWLANGPMSLESATDICVTFNISLDWLVLGRGAMRPRVDPMDQPTSQTDSMAAFARIYNGLPATSRELLDRFVQSLDA